METIAITTSNLTSTGTPPVIDAATINAMINSPIGSATYKAKFKEEWDKVKDERNLWIALFVVGALFFGFFTYKVVKK